MSDDARITDKVISLARVCAVVGGIEPPSIDGRETVSSRSHWRAAGTQLVRSTSGSSCRRSCDP